jgi:hypothetical protein
LPTDKEARLRVIKDFTAKLLDHPVIKEVEQKVLAITAKFSVPGIE